MTTFTMTVPGQWTRVDLTQADPEAAIAAALAPFVRAAPVSQQPAVRRLLTDGVTPAIRELAGEGALCAIVAANPFDPSPLRPVMALRRLPGLTSELFGGAGETRDLRAVLVDLAADEEDPELIGLGDEATALRRSRWSDVTQQFTDTVLPQLEDAFPVPAAPAADPADQRELPVEPTLARVDQDDTRLLKLQVEYIIGHSTEVDRWIVAQFVVDTVETEPGRALAMALASVFDAMISTFRWDS